MINDNSSQEDRDEMVRLYPFITYIMKSQKEIGTTISMNILRGCTHKVHISP